MVKAEDLVKEQLDREKLRKQIYKKVYKNIETKIIQNSKINNYSCWYQVPEFMINYPLYNVEDCKKYISKKLKGDGFNYNFLDNHIIVISWSK